jgi:hypothetical protein
LRRDLDGRKFRFRQWGDRQAREGNHPEQHQGEGQQNGRDRVIDAPGRDACVLLHGLAPLDHLRRLGHDLHGRAGFEPRLAVADQQITGFTPLMMSWPLP